jgi:hypothetical protein
MTQFTLHKVKDLGLQREVSEALPYAVVGGAWEGSFETALAKDAYKTVLSHIVPAGHQLKLLFLRVWTQESTGARFSIVQTNPTAAGQTGDVEAYPVVGSVPEGVRDYPMLEAAGAEVLRGSLKDPVHVLEGSIEFRILGAVTPSSSAYRYGFVYWGVEKTPE